MCISELRDFQSAACVYFYAYIFTHICIHIHECVFSYSFLFIFFSLEVFNTIFEKKLIRTMKPSILKKFIMLKFPEKVAFIFAKYH